MPDHRRLVENIFFLYLLQGSNYLIPLITVPYLIRSLGLELFGLLAFSYSLHQFLIIITNYGFHLTGTQLISVHRDNPEKLSMIASNIWGTKFVLLLLCAVVMGGAVITFPALRSYWKVHAITFLAVIGQALFPNWYFMGMERMKHITWITVVARLIGLVGLILYVRDTSDLLFAAFFQVIGECISGLIGTYLALKMSSVRLFIPRVNSIIDLLKEGWEIFLSQIYVTLFTSANTCILGILTTNEIVGIFATAEKVIRAAINLVGPLSSALYPRVSEMIHTSFDQTISFLRNIVLIGSIGFTTLAIVLCCFSDQITTLLIGTQHADISLLIKIMSITPLTIFLDNIYGTQLLLNLSLKKEFIRAIVFSGVFSVVSSFIFVPRYQSYATASIFVVSELLVLVGMVIPIHRRGIYLFFPQKSSVKLS